MISRFAVTIFILLRTALLNVCTSTPVTANWGGSAKFFVKSNGDTVIQNRGVLTDRELSKIQCFIKDNYKEMYLKWASMSENGFFGEN